MTLRIWISLFVFASHFTAFSTSHAQVDHVRPESSHVISKHDGSKDDIEAIGNRKVGKGRWGNWYSFEKEVALGRQYSNAILHTAKLVDDQRLTEYVDRLGQNIVRNSDAKVAFTIRVIDSEEINAFALPGGFLYVNSALLLAAQDEAELAAVMHTR
jgi:predicted Zn-dependent protease